MTDRPYGNSANMKARERKRETEREREREGEGETERVRVKGWDHILSLYDEHNNIRQLVNASMDLSNFNYLLHIAEIYRPPAPILGLDIHILPRNFLLP